MSLGAMPLSFCDGAWHISNYPLSEIAAEFSTPLFVYGQHTLESQFHNLRAALPDVVDLYYSIKANPNPAIVRHFAVCAAGLEIASAADGDMEGLQAAASFFVPDFEAEIVANTWAGQWATKYQEIYGEKPAPWHRKP